MILGSTSKNITLLSTVITISTLIGLWQFSFTIRNLIMLLISFYILNILGNWMTLHRYYAHKSFEFKNKTLKWAFTILAVLSGRGSPISWVYIHRLHHHHSDQEKDPHSPKVLGYKLFGFNHFQHIQEDDFKVFLVKDLMDKYQLFIHKYYMVILGMFASGLALLDIELLYYLWIVPLFLIQVCQNNFNFFGHKVGYRNFETRDESRNNFWFFPLVLGECWHNNHHADPKNVSTQHKKYEYDPIKHVIKLIRS